MKEEKFIICDTCFWYNIVEGEISAESIEGLKLVATGVSIFELGLNDYILKDPLLLQKVIKTLKKHHYKIIIENPLDYILTLLDPEINIDNSLSSEILNSFDNWINIDVEEIDNEYKEKTKASLLLKKDKMKLFVDDINSNVVSKREIYKEKKHRKKYLSTETIDYTKELISDTLAHYSKTQYGIGININDDLWNKIQLFVSVWDIYTKMMFTEKDRKFHKDDLQDLLNLVYVSPADKYFTSDKMWNYILSKNIGLKKYKFEIN